MVYAKLFSKLNEEIRKKNKKQKNIARNLGISPEQLNQFLKTTVKIRFTLFVKLLVEIFEDEISKIESYLETFILVTPKVENVRECLEWSSHNGKNKLFEKALNRAASDKKLKETASCYQLMLERRTKRRPLLQIFDEIEEMKFKIKQRENAALLNLLSLNILDDLNRSSSISLYARSTSKIIEQISEGYIKGAYEFRLNQLLTISLLKEGNAESAIEKGEKLLKEDAYIISKIYIYSIVAQAYLFSNKEKAIFYVEKAIELFYNNPIDDYRQLEHALKSTSDFIKIHLNHLDDLYLEDMAEKAHYYAKIGKKEKSLKLLDELENSNGKLTPFQLYYKAISTNKKEDFDLAKDAFITSGNLFYCKLIKKIH